MQLMDCFVVLLCRQWSIYLRHSQQARKYGRPNVLTNNKGLTTKIANCNGSALLCEQLMKSSLLPSLISR